MKTLHIAKALAPFALCLLLACGDSPAAAQDDVPPTIVANMMRLYPEAEDLDWGIDGNDNWEVHFEVDDEKARADFKPDGTWIETEESLKWDELPEVVQDAIKRDYDKDDIVEIEHTMSAEKGEFYDVEIDPKGKKKFDLAYSKEGKILGKNW